MKRRSITILVFTVMVIAILGIGFVISVNIPVVKAAFTTPNSQYTASAIQFLISCVLIFVCWIALFIIFIRLLNSENFIEFGKKDNLTGIGNRNYLESVYKKQANTYGNQLYLVYFAFLPRKLVAKYNETFLNQIQKLTASSLSEACARGEYAARIGDGEFAMLFIASNGVRAQQRVLELVNKLNQCQYQAVFEITSPIQSGFSSVSDKSISFITVLENAKTAYRHAVNHSLDTYIYSNDLVELEDTDKLRAKQLLDAINNKEFEVFMQLIYDVKNQKFAGAEALSRWNSNDGLVMPASYIGDMHKCGVIQEFDMYMFEKVCNILQNWKDDDDFKDLFVSCNITRATISSNSFTLKVKEIAGKYDFPRENLIIEVTEDALIDDLDVAYDNMAACREMGFKVALDDFGAGHTSFTDIHTYPFDQMKIDRQFAKTITTERGSALMNAFVDMAHKLEIPVVFEGIETKEQVKAVNKLRVEYIQGHYYSYVYSMKEIRSKYLEAIK